jgi:acyl carrier protein
MGRTLETVKTIIGEYVNRDANDINDTDHLIDDLGLDSLDSIEVIMNIEEKLGIELGDDELSEVRNVAQLAEILDSKLKAL